MKYLFWNTHRNKQINPVLCDMIIENRVSIVALAEYSADADALISLLYSSGILMKQIPTVGCDHIVFFGRAGICIEPNLQTDRASIQVVEDNIILCCIHLNSQIYSGNADRREIEIEQIICDIQNLERERCTNNTIVVGDFNLNPYDSSCISARYFHGLPVYEDAKRQSRRVAGREFYMFYNPMWNFLGDFKEPYGTYYHNSADAINPYWNIFDQVIIRPSLRERFLGESLRIVTETTNRSLLDKNKHPDISVSDHLPIIFEIMEECYA